MWESSEEEFSLDAAPEPIPLFGTPSPVEPASPDSFEELYDEYARKIYSFSLSMLRNREDAEDAVQTTFMNAFGSLQGGCLPRQEAPWLYRIARNVCLNRIRTLQRKPASTLEGLDVPALRCADESAIEHLHVVALRSALERLPLQQRTAFVMRELQGASYREIADALSTTQGAVESLIFRARRQLAATLQQLQLPPEELGQAAA